MRIAVVHNALDPGCPPDEQDVLIQADAVAEALALLGHQTVQLTCDLNLENIRQRLSAEQPDLVFNLVESLSGTGRLIHCFPALLDAMGLPYTGSSAEALFLTSNKLLAKAHLQAAGLPTPAWIIAGVALRCLPGELSDAQIRSSRWIIKSVWEHASIGLDANAIIPWTNAGRMNSILRERKSALGGSCFSEAFIEGREFNLSVLDSPDGPRILPPAEIIFEGYHANTLRIVDYRAKWDASSFEYHHTPRRFEFNPEDQVLLDQLHTQALACWHSFDLSGYARVDFRVDTQGRPWILEVNANPCISPDAGFAAAIQQAGLTYASAVNDILSAKSIGKT